MKVIMLGWRAGGLVSVIRGKRPCQRGWLHIAENGFTVGGKSWSHEGSWPGPRRSERLWTWD